MKPRSITQEDIEYWEQTGVPVTTGPMLGRHLGAKDIPTVIRQGDKIRVAWELDERDVPDGIAKCDTIWTTFSGGMLPTDVIIA